MSTMDSGSACSRYNIYGQMVYWVVTTWTLTMDYSQVIYWSVDVYYSMEMKLYTTSDDISGRYYNDVNINQWNFYLLHTSYIIKTVSSSDVAIIDVCIYSGQRFAPINIPNYAGSVDKTIFFV